MSNEDGHDLQGQIFKQYQDAREAAVKTMRTWNELLAASTDMAFDVVLKNWNYNRSLRGSTEQAMEDTLKTQHQLAKEMMQVWKGYADSVQDILSRVNDK